ncbi:MAG: type I-C CRISPR-associated protein Cas7/Csd2 [Calditrichaeota bacterium]|nr:MAG: type I-C CRISPR-associated protein Cas7/Csd2 [Calditrichota bacterium]
MEAIKNRYEFIFIFDVENGNPNGDPDAGNMPRMDPETSHGLVTDVSIKRKIRNYVEIVHQDKAPYCIYVKEKAILTHQQKRAYESLKISDKNSNHSDIEMARAWMCQNFYDVRTFGAVMSLKEFNCGQVRGPVQINFAKSIDPIMPQELSITRMAVATEAEAKKQKGDNRTIGKKALVSYGLYKTEGYISAHFAKNTGFNEEDLQLLWESLINMYDHDHSASRGKMNSRKLIVFKHDSPLGNAPAHQLFDRVRVKKKDDLPPRSFDQYTIEIDRTKLPEGIEIDEQL